jgi:hypothetical protein
VPKSEASSIFSSVLTNQTLMCGAKIIKPCLCVKRNQVLTSREKQIQFAQLCYTHSQSSHKDPKSTTKAIQDHHLVHTEHAHKMYARPSASTSGCINMSTTTSSPGSTSSTSAPPCAATTRDPAARVLPQHCRAPRLLVTRPHRLYVNLAVRREYSSSCRSGSTSTTPYAATTSSSGRTTTSTTYLD